MILLLVVPLFLLVLIGGLWWYQNFSTFASHINKIPGPPGLPILGVFFEYLTGKDQIYLNDRYRCKTYPGIFKFWLFYAASVFFQNPEDIEIVLSSSTKFMQKSKIYEILHMWLGTGLLTSDGDKWKIRRKLLTPAFHFNILKGFVDVFNESAEKLVQELERRCDEEYIDVVPPITEYTLQSIAESSMGTYLDSTKATNKSYKKAMLEFTEESIHRLSKPWLYDEIVYSLTASGRKAKESIKILHKFTNNIISERKGRFQGTSYAQTKRLAMLDLLIKAQREEGIIDDDGIREEVDTFMFEGHDTTAVALSHILLVLANQKKEQDEIRQEIIDVIGDGDKLPSYNDLQELPYTERCLKECLRLYPSVLLIGRHVDEDITTSTGYIVPKGCMVHIFIFDLHRNPEIYPDPEKFDPDRFLPENISKRHPFAYIPFSAGSRNCIGQRFAMLELKAALCAILRKFVLEPVDRREDIVFTADLVLRSKNPIRVKFVKRSI